ncbi:MAG: response regulator [Pseudomonadota bacterium]
MESTNAYSKDDIEAEEVNLLVAEDDSFTRMILTDILQGAGYRAVDVENGREALERLQEEKFDLLLSDIHMPELSGLELIREMAAKSLSVPTVILTGNSDLEIAIEAMKAGASDYLVKDENIDQTVLLAIEGALEKERIKARNRKLLKDLAEKNEQLNTTLLQVEEANRKILDSIHYASRIQGGLLPSDDVLSASKIDAFSLWKPRDIVAGDIYLIERIGSRFIISVVDCTGHGVPGAFMTMLASSNLNRLISDEDCHDPARILQLMNARIRAFLGQNQGSDGGADDGMDAAVCVVDPEQQRIVYSGARIPLLRADAEGVEMIKGDRQSIGYHDSNPDFEFTNHELELKPDTAFYLVTDGFVDQVGGDKGFPFGYRRLKKVVDEIHTKPWSAQHSEIDRVLTEYRGDYEPRDDVTVVGFGLER